MLHVTVPFNQICKNTVVIPGVVYFITVMPMKIYEIFPRPITCSGLAYLFRTRKLPSSRRPGRVPWGKDHCSG